MAYILSYQTAEFVKYKITLSKAGFLTIEDALRHYHKHIDAANIVKAWITEDIPVKIVIEMKG